MTRDGSDSGASPDPEIQTLAAAILAVAAFALALSCRADFDLWWHLAVGRFVALRHALPVPDPFSFTAAGRPWVAHEWLIELGMYRLAARTGLLGLDLAFSACACAAVVISSRTLRRAGAGLWTEVLALVILFSIQPYLGPRPHVAAFLLMAIVVDRIESWRAAGGPSIWILPPLFALWANVHGSFVIGLAVPVLVVFGEMLARAAGRRPGAGRIGTLAAVLAVSLVAVCANPNGPRLLLYPLTKLHNPALHHLEEWGALDPTDPRCWGFTAFVAGTLLLAGWRRASLRVSDFVIAGAFLSAGVWSLRCVPFAVLAVGPLTARMLRDPSPRDATPVPAAGSRSRHVLHRSIFALAALALIASVDPYEAENDERLPVVAVDALGANGLCGRIFHPYEWGGYLIWRLWPEVRVFVDGRGDDLYTDGGELAAYAAAVEDLAGVEDLLDSRRIRTVLFERDTPFVRHLLAVPR